MADTTTRPLPGATMKDRRAGDGRHIDYEFQVGAPYEVDGEQRRKLAILSCTFEKAGMSYFNGRSHPTQYRATLSNVVDIDRAGPFLDRAGPFHARSFTLGAPAVRILDEEATRYSQKTLGVFASRALERLTELYVEGNENVTGYFEEES
jgi:hypothetical protein